MVKRSDGPKINAWRCAALEKCVLRSAASLKHISDGAEGGGSRRALKSSEVRSWMDDSGGKASISLFNPAPLPGRVDSGEVSIRLWSIWDIVETMGESAQGVDDVKSCSNAGSINLPNHQSWLHHVQKQSTDLIKLSAASDPNGNCIGRSKMLPNKMSSAE